MKTDAHVDHVPANAIDNGGASGRAQTLQIEALPMMEDFPAATGRALQAARTDAKVLIIRNTVAYAPQTQQALEEIIRAGEEQTADAELLFTRNGTVATHPSSTRPRKRRAKTNVGVEIEASGRVS